MASATRRSSSPISSLDAATVDAAAGEIRVHFTVRNTGTRAGVAVPQLYVRDLVASVVRPVKELKAFGRVELQAGASARVTFAVPTDMLSFTGMAGRRIVEPGEFELQVGASSADIRLRGLVEVTGAPARSAASGGWRAAAGRLERHEPLGPAPAARMIVFQLLRRRFP